MNPLAELNSFLSDVVDRFALGELIGVSRVDSEANRLWRLDAVDGVYLVKEFAYESLEQSASLQRAAEFEWLVWCEGTIAMPEPLRATSGGAIEVVRSSRGGEVLTRVHRWVEGDAVTLPVSPGDAFSAGVQLGLIQQSGERFGWEPGGDLWGRSDRAPLVVLERLIEAGVLDKGEGRAARAAIDAGEQLVVQANALSDRWVFTHFDFKPQNCMRVGDVLVVLDWDECAFCHPGLEAVEAAVRWAGGANADREVFVAFLEGYWTVRPRVRALQPVDFAKWVVALVGWFGFMGRRALGDFGETDAEMRHVQESAVQTLRGLRITLDCVGEWAAWVA